MQHGEKPLSRSLSAFSSSASLRLCVQSLFLLTLTTHAAGQPIVHKDATWTVSLDPATLAVTATLPNGSRLPVSDPAFDKPERTADLSTKNNTTTWTLPDLSIQATAEFTPGQLRLHFTCDRDQQLPFPRTPTAHTRALILPKLEGAYVPADDPKWLAYLTSDNASGTVLESLSMPFVGVACDNNVTLTHIVPTPYNTTVAFPAGDGRATAQFTHHFTSTPLYRDYEVILRLTGPSPIDPARAYRQYLVDHNQLVTLADKQKQTPNVERLYGAPHAYLWGDGASVEFLRKLKAAGLDRLCLTLGDLHPDTPSEVATEADKLGYLLGPYDSYHSIHSPDARDTWITAQFDRALYESGPIVQANGKKKPGFQNKGYLLSPLAARPYVEQRVNGIMSRVPFTSWFVDCDAFGQVYDDFSPTHPATRADDLAARLARMAWMRDAHGLVVGSEGGMAYAAGVIAFAHGMTTPAFGGWLDPDFKDRNSPYFLGAYWPPTGPAVFTRAVPLKPDQAYLHYDPRFRLPLYQAVFHDAVVATHHWSSASLKFSDLARTTTLLELLYNVPPLYHLNTKEFEKLQKRIVQQAEFFSPIHKLLVAHPVTGFDYVTPDRLVQRARFSGRYEMLANFSQDKPADVAGIAVPPNAAVFVDGETKQQRTFVCPP